MTPISAWPLTPASTTAVPEMFTPAPPSVRERSAGIAFFYFLFIFENEGNDAQKLVFSEVKNVFSNILTFS